ncbi:hypothetical protein RyT2_10600 [Pseudolactococcus yaeyamensis]
MNYELLTMIGIGTEAWKGAKQRINEKGGQVLTIFPSQDFAKTIKDEGVEGINVFDHVIKRTYDLTRFMFFNQAPVPARSEIFMNTDFSISIIHEGDEIAVMERFPNTRRYVKNIQYLHSNGEKDFVEEYTIDGQLFSEIFYFNNKPQEIHFYNEKRIPVISYYFYEEQLLYLTLNDETTGELITEYTSLDQFISEQVSKLVTPEDTVTVSYMGMEMTALAKTKSHNILHLIQSPFDEKGEVRGTLLHILNDTVSYIHEVEMSLEDKQALIEKGIAVSKVTVVEN